MLAIRMQRTGRKGHAMFRVVVQDSRRTPTSGKIVAQLGSYDPHAKTVILDKEKAGFYLEHGAQPSDRVTVLLKKEGVKLPEWVSQPDKKDQKTRNPDKRRSTRPDEPEAPAEKPAEEPAEAADAPAEPAEAPAQETETPSEEPAPETEAEEPAKADAPAEAEEEKPAEEPEAAEEKPAESAEAEETDDKKSAE